MKSKFEELKSNSLAHASEYTPEFFRLSTPIDKNRLENLIEKESTIIVHDEIIGQLEELVKSTHPKIRFSKAELSNAITQHVGKVLLDDYGVWVYYPWSNRLVHLLDENEFVAVRTNRNQYKITPQESKVLSTKTIGVIGLSVGKAITMTIAMERICGKIKIADFDVIELSNLNRIQTGVQNFGIKKTVVVAREIAEIDPFLKVELFSDGLTEENADDFFVGTSKLDVCIEVCDGLYTKIFSRQKAKKLGIPVVMNSSDRGTTDVERYDLDPNYAILHGLIDHLDLSLIKEAKTNEEKVPYLLPMLGVDTSSSRLKASMLEIEETITTWPQLASGVIFGGGICTDVCRRILLNQFSMSGRYFVDIEDLINDQIVDYIALSSQSKKNPSTIKNVNLEFYNQELNDLLKLNLNHDLQSYVDLSSIQLNEILQSAISAPSGGNAQPWNWLYQQKCLILFHDETRSESILNYQNHAAHIAFGAAIENVSLSAAMMGLKEEVIKFPLGIDSKLIALIYFKEIEKDSVFDPELKKLAHAIPKRITNRMLSQRVQLEKGEVDYLKSLVTKNEVFSLHLLSDEKELNRMKEILSEVDQLYLTNKNGNYYFNKELRWDANEVNLTRDGIDLSTIDLTPTEKAGMLVSRDWSVTNHIHNWKLGTAFGKHAKKSVDSASSIAILAVKSVNNSTYLEAGRMIERIWLGATSQGIAFQPMSISTFLFARINDGNTEGIEDIEGRLQELRLKLRHTLQLTNDEKEVFLFILAKVADPAVKAIRRKLEDVFLNA